MQDKFHSNGAEQFESPCVSFNLRKCSHIVGRIYEREMHDAPVHGPLFGILIAVRKRGSVSITALAKDMGLDRTTLTRNLRPLEEQGFIRIAPLSANRKEVTLLEKGEVALERSLASWRNAQTKVLRELGEDRWERMRKDLAAVMALDERI